MKTRELQTLWWDWLGTSERLLRTLHEQTAALTLRDLARIEKIQPELDALQEHMRQTDDRAATCARELAAELGVKPSLRSLTKCLEEAEAQQVQSLANRVKVTARNLQNVLDRNKELIENELTFVNGTLTLIAKSASDNGTKYGRRASSAAVVVDQAA